MTKKFIWTNNSVLKFAAGADPVEAIELKAREFSLTAMDEGWTGPPFDPLLLAKKLGMMLEARGDIPDARIVPSGNKVILEYNPTRPRGRLRFSIAHEVAHTFFPDHGERVRHRGGDATAGNDDWQLEVLCNIGAAELLMPSGSFAELIGAEISIDKVNEVRKHFDVSVEACLIRLVKLARMPCAAFCASAHKDGRYKVDYVIPALGWDCPVSVGTLVPKSSVVGEANAIGHTAKGVEEWAAGKLTRVECMGLAPYPGSVVPRVVGLLIAAQETDYVVPEIKEVHGDALAPKGAGLKLVAHVIPDTNTVWGGNGFASQMRRHFPNVWTDFRKEASAKRPPTLGNVYFGPLADSVCVAHMVAQRGIGTSATQRLRYAALAQCLGEVREKAKELGASVHMPRVGTGHGGANWQVIKELIAEELVDKGIPTTVYSLPN